MAEVAMQFSGGSEKTPARRKKLRRMNPIYEGSSLMIQSLPKAPPPITITLEVRVSTSEFGGGHNHLVHNTPQLMKAGEICKEIRERELLFLYSEGLSMLLCVWINI